MSPLQFFARVCCLIATVILVPLAIWGCGTEGLGDSSTTTNHYATTIACTQTITVQMTRAEYDEAVAAGEPLEEIPSDSETPDAANPNQVVTASQCLNVGNEPAEG